jgi:hypothetical protein
MTTQQTGGQLQGQKKNSYTAETNEGKRTKKKQEIRHYNLIQGQR